MDRSMIIPFTKGKLTATLEITGPLCDTDDAEITLDGLFRKYVHDLMKDGIPALNTLSDKIETDNGGTTTAIALELEVLGTQVKLSVEVSLGFGVDADLVRAMITQNTVPAFSGVAVDTISGIMLIDIFGNEDKVQQKPRPISSLGDLLGGLAGVEGTLIRVG